MYDLSSMSCSYVLAGHTDTILCLDTSISSNGRRLILTGSKDNSVRFFCFLTCAYKLATKFCLC